MPRPSTAVSDGTMLVTHTPASSTPSAVTCARARIGPRRQAWRGVVLELVRGRRQQAVGDAGPGQDRARFVGGHGFHGRRPDVDAHGDRT